jgi:hypothetical protein
LSRRRAAWVAALVVVAGALGAFLYYIAWPAPLLDGERIESFAFGPEDFQLRDLILHQRTEEGATVERLITLINDAPLASDVPQGNGTGFAVILVGDDGLQYRLRPLDRGGEGERGLVGLSEGSDEYRGHLVSPELAREIAALEQREDSVRE